MYSGNLSGLMTARAQKVEARARKLTAEHKKGQAARELLIYDEASAISPEMFAEPACETASKPVENLKRGPIDRIGAEPGQKVRHVASGFCLTVPGEDQIFYVALHDSWVSITNEGGRLTSHCSGRFWGDTWAFEIVRTKKSIPRVRYIRWKPADSATRPTMPGERHQAQLALRELDGFDSIDCLAMPEDRADVWRINWR